MPRPKQRTILDNRVQCWFCGAEAMQPKRGYYQCAWCGATWVEMPNYDVHPLKSGKRFPTPDGQED